MPSAAAHLFLSPGTGVPVSLCARAGYHLLVYPTARCIRQMRASHLIVQYRETPKREVPLIWGLCGVSNWSSYRRLTVRPLVSEPRGVGTSRLRRARKSS